MKTIIKLLIAVAILNAVARAGLAVARFYELKDAAQQLVTFGADAAPNDIQNEIMKKAQELQLPLDYDGVDVRRDGVYTIASASYTDPIELFPSYQYPYTFTFSVEGVALNRTGPNPLAQPAAP
jgi:hypothetical protein